LWSTTREGQASDWFSDFRSSVTSVEDAKCLVHLSASKTDKNVDGMKEFVLKNSIIGLCGVADMLGICFDQFIVF
jgi:hypothetical protein